VAKTKEKQVAYPVCNDVPEQKCGLQLCEACTGRCWVE